MNFIQKQLFKASSKLSSKNTIVSVELEDGKISDDENDLVGYFNEIEGLERKILAVKHADFSGLNDFFSGAYAISNYMSDSNFSILATKELDLPIIGSLLKYLGFVFVNRSGKKEEKKDRKRDVTYYTLHTLHTLHTHYTHTTHTLHTLHNTHTSFSK